MSTTTPELDLLTHSPDGESRGILFRVGDLFPMDPTPHRRSQIDEPASEARPWGLRHLQQPTIRAGKHESDTGKHTSSQGDGQNPEETGTD